MMYTIKIIILLMITGLFVRCSINKKLARKSYFKIESIKNDLNAISNLSCSFVNQNNRPIADVLLIINETKEVRYSNKSGEFICHLEPSYYSFNAIYVNERLSTPKIKFSIGETKRIIFVFKESQLNQNRRDNVPKLSD